jgi:DNA-binding response OmpR family regulator
MKKNKKLKIAIVEDSRAYLKFLSVFLEKIGIEQNLEVSISVFDNPVDFKVNRDVFDIVILDYVFRQYTYGANGFYLARFIKERLPKCFVIIHSSYTKSEIKDILNEFSTYIDAYSQKESDFGLKNQSLEEIFLKYLEDHGK